MCKVKNGNTRLRFNVHYYKGNQEKVSIGILLNITVDNKDPHYYIYHFADGRKVRTNFSFIRTDYY